MPALGIGLDLEGYRKTWLRPDVVAGLAVAAYLIPQVMAYAAIVGLPPETGLWAACAAIVVYAVLGSSRLLSIGPESTTALMTAVTVAPLAHGDPERYATLCTQLALLVGLICFVGWTARAGALADLLSRPVLVGYLAGIGISMIVSQLGKLTGVSVDGETVWEQLRSFGEHVDQVHWPTVAVGVGSMLVVFVGYRARPNWPWLLVVMLGAITLTAGISLGQYDIALVGSAESGLPTPHVPDLAASDLQDLALPAVGIAVVGYSDNMLTARAFAGRNSTDVDGNRELLALSGTNIAAGLFRGFPVSSSASRTALAHAQGARTQIYSLVALCFVLLILGTGTSLLEHLPFAVLGAAVVFAATQLIDVPGFVRIARFRTSELALALVTTSGVLLFGVLYGVLAAVGLSILDLLRRMARPHDGILGYAPGVAGMHDMDDYPDAHPVPGLVVYRYDATLCFANAADFRRRALAAVDSSTQPVYWFLLNAEANVEIDSTAAQTLEEVRAELADRGIVIALARVKHELMADLVAAGFADAVGREHFYMTLPTAVEAYQKWLRVQPEDVQRSLS